MPDPSKPMQGLGFKVASKDPETPGEVDVDYVNSGTRVQAALDSARQTLLNTVELSAIAHSEVVLANNAHTRSQGGATRAMGAPRATRANKNDKVCVQVLYRIGIPTTAGEIQL